jgi:hypothetical protein
MSRLAPVSAVLLVLVAGCSTEPKPSEAGRSSSAPGGSSSAPAGLVSEEIGKPFAYEETFTNTSDSNKWTVTVDKVECGLASFDGVDTQPAAGQAFCRLDASIKNSDDERALTPDEFGRLQTDQGEFEPDEAVTGELMQAEDLSAVGPFAPGDTARTVTVWQVPAEAKPIAVRYPDFVFNNGAEYRITVG